MARLTASSAVSMIGRPSISDRLAQQEATSLEAPALSDLAMGPPALVPEHQVSVLERLALAQEHQVSGPEHPDLELARQALERGHRDLALVRPASEPVRELVRVLVKSV